MTVFSGFFYHNLVMLFVLLDLVSVYAVSEARRDA